MTKIVCNSIEEFKQEFKKVPPCPDYYCRIIFPVLDPKEFVIGVHIVDGIEGDNSNLPLIEYNIVMSAALGFKESNLSEIYNEFYNKLYNWVENL